MLETRKSITLNGTSQIISASDKEDRITVVTMTANISDAGNSNIITNIIHKDVYEANKEECRADIDAFTAAVRAVEDGEE